MRIHQSRWTFGTKWTTPLSTDTNAQLVLAFGDRLLLEAGAPLADVRDAYPNARIVGCSTGGEICGERVVEGELSVAAVAFERSRIECVTSNVREGHSYAAGLELARQLPPDDLVHVFVLASGLRVNGSELVRGLTAALPPEVTVTGGLAGDGNRFARTFTVWDGAMADEGVVAIGLYGNSLRVGFGSLGGWDSFGPERLVTRSTGTELFELDGTPALELYKRYLGAQAEGLPGSGMFFPLSLRTEDGGGVVRTLLSIDEARGSLTFAGEIPQGRYVRLMRGNFERLIDGAAEAARLSELPLEGTRAELAILVSCVGRRAVLGQRVEEEIEGVRDALGESAVMTGFYSYGEIGPFALGGRCELHNQTMTVTTLSEL